jgi:hypothetical protein
MCHSISIMVSTLPATPPADFVTENAALTTPANPASETPALVNQLPAPGGNAPHFTEVDVRN